ncbi:MAG TPA: hypothetical protein DEQ32_13270 [Gammaproteobacteria bacterium]|nr:hypothetical protein [Gammaproteobacteria bacterium]|tara:strand:- start:1724 stop:2659 length:936 start_codon:yes stop_codon:yes gene_type:complete
MKHLIENWKRFLVEAKKGPHQIYCDMDGVLVDFVAGAVKQINEDISDSNLPSRDENGKLTRLGKLRVALHRADADSISADQLEKFSSNRSPVRTAAIKYMYARLDNDVEFWANLPWMPNGRNLWNTIKKYQPHILTHPMGVGSEEGKERWIQKNLSPVPEEIYMSGQKYKWATKDGAKNILIDDFSTNIEPWKKHGGIGIHYEDENIAEAIEKLQELGFSVLRDPHEHDLHEPDIDHDIDDEDDGLYEVKRSLELRQEFKKMILEEQGMEQDSEESHHGEDRGLYIDPETGIITVLSEKDLKPTRSKKTNS